MRHGFLASVWTVFFLYDPHVIEFTKMLWTFCFFTPNTKTNRVKKQNKLVKQKRLSRLIKTPFGYLYFVARKSNTILYNQTTVKLTCSFFIFFHVSRQVVAYPQHAGAFRTSVCARDGHWSSAAVAARPVASKISYVEK